MLFLLFLVLHSATTLNAEICGSKSIVCLNSTSYKSCINPGGSAITTGDVEICDTGTVCDSSEGVYPCITETTSTSTTPSITTASTSSSDTLCGSKSIICLNSTSYQTCINPGETAVVTGKVQNCDAGTVCDSSEGVYPCVTQITTTSTTASITTSTISTITAGTTSTATTSTTSSSSSSETLCGSKSIVCLNSTSYQSCINPGETAVVTGKAQICDVGTVCDSSEGVYPCVAETTTSTTSSITISTTSSSDTICGSKSIVCLNSTSYQSCINPGETAVVTGKAQTCDVGTVCDSSEGVYPCVTQTTTTSTTASITTASTTSTITAGTTSTATTSTTSSSSSSETLCGSKSIVCLNSTSYQSCINPGETAVVTGKAQICDVGTVCDSSEEVYPCVAETTTSTTSSITISTTSSSDTICGSKSIVCLNSTSYQSCINPGETAVVTGKAQTCDVGTVCDSSEGVYPCVTQTTTTSTTASITTASTTSTITAGTTSTATTSTTSSSSSSKTLCGSKSIICLNSTSYQSCINPGETAVVTGKAQICDVGTVCDSSEGVYPCVAKTTTSTTSSITTSTTSSSDTICGSKSIVCLNSTSYQTCINPGETAVLTGKAQICDVGTVCDSSEGVYPCIQSTESSQAISTSSTTTLFTATSEPFTTSSTESTSISSTISSSPTASITSTTTINTPTTSPTTTTTLEPSTSSTTSTSEPSTTTSTESTSISSTILSSPTASITSTTTINPPTTSPTTTTTLEPSTSSTTSTPEPSTSSSTESTSISSTISSSPTASITSTTTINTPTTSPTTTTTLEPSTSSTTSTLEPTTTTTTIRPTTISTTTTTTLRPTTTTTTTTSTTTAAPFECTAVGNFPASNCNEYYECVYILYYYKTTLLTCASGQSFDSTSQSCVEDSTCTG